MHLFNRIKMEKNSEYDSNMFSEKIESLEKKESLFLFEEDNVDKNMLNTLINLDNLNGSDIPRNMRGQRFESFLVKLYKQKTTSLTEFTVSIKQQYRTLSELLK